MALNSGKSARAPSRRARLSRALPLGDGARSKARGAPPHRPRRRGQRGSRAPPWPPASPAASARGGAPFPALAWAARRATRASVGRRSAAAPGAGQSRGARGYLPSPDERLGDLPVPAPEAGRNEVAHAGALKEGRVLDALVEAFHEEPHLLEADSHNRRLGVCPHVHPVDEARADRHNVLQRTAQLHAKCILRSRSAVLPRRGQRPRTRRGGAHGRAGRTRTTVTRKYGRSKSFL